MSHKIIDHLDYKGSRNKKRHQRTDKNVQSKGDLLLI